MMDIGVIKPHAYAHQMIEDIKRGFIDEFLQGMPPGRQEAQQKAVGIAPAGTNLYIMPKKRQ